MIKNCLKFCQKVVKGWFGIVAQLVLNIVAGIIVNQWFTNDTNNAIIIQDMITYATSWV